ncbi:outer surface protein [Streptococcus pyogenes]|nr:outer surface protein [Streptococcus pyogenes]
MVDLGFSLYPERYDVTKSKTYIDLCHSYGAKRLFMSLLQLAPAVSLLRRAHCLCKSIRHSSDC